MKLRDVNVGFRGSVGGVRITGCYAAKGGVPLPNYGDLLNEVKSQIREVDPLGAEARWDEALFLDVREPEEYGQGAILRATHIPRGQLESQVEGLLVDKSTPIIVYCAGGARSAFAAKTLRDLGYADVLSMEGGFNRWKDEGRGWSVPRVLDDTVVGAGDEVAFIPPVSGG